MASLLARLRAAAEHHNIIPEMDFAADLLSFTTARDEEASKSPSPTTEESEADSAVAWPFDEELYNADTESDREAMPGIATSTSTEMVLYQSRPSSNHAHSDEEAVLGSTDFPELERLWSPATPSSAEPDQESLPADGMSPPPISTDPDDIPLEVLKVAQWARRDSTYKAFPKAKAWQCTVQANRELGINAKIRTSTEYRKEILTEYPLASHQNLFVTGARRSGFVNGRALLNLSLIIHTCVGEARPARLYRAIHDKMPHDGIGARGLELTNTNGLFFQRFLQNHFTWNCRQPSPFLSTSSQLEVALNYVFSFEQRRYTGIKLLEISTTGKYWDHHISRLWEVKHILSKLQLRHKDFHKHEYLVENLIPKEHVVRVYEWRNPAHRRQLDPRGSLQNKFYRDQQKRADTFEELAKQAAEERELKRKREEELGEIYEKKRIARTNAFQSVISQGTKKKALTSG